MSLPYYKRYPRDFFEGTAGMSGEVKCAYALLLDIIYIHSGELPDDPHYISGQLGYSVRKWNIIKKELLERGKITCGQKIISNKRADKEQIILRSYLDNKQINGRGSNKNKDLSEATALQPEPEPKEGNNNPTTIDDISKESKSLKSGVGWFSEAEISRLSEEYEYIEASRKLNELSFKAWCEKENASNPKLIARRWLDSQKKKHEADLRLTKIHASKGPIKTTPELLASLSKSTRMQ